MGKRPFLFVLNINHHPEVQTSIPYPFCYLTSPTNQQDEGSIEILLILVLFEFESATRIAFFVSHESSHSSLNNFKIERLNGQKP
jgi:hypothetical protein